MLAEASMAQAPWLQPARMLFNQGSVKFKKLDLVSEKRRTFDCIAL